MFSAAIEAAATAAGGGGGEDVGSGAVDEPIDQALVADDVAAVGAEGFAECADADGDSRFDFLQFSQAAAGRAEDAGGVGFVDHEHGLMSLGYFCELNQGGRVAVHTEEAVGDDEASGVVGVALE